MPKFMFLHRGSCDGSAQMSPEEKQKAMQAYGEWFQDGKSRGWLLDCGDGLEPEGRVVHADHTVTDGPFAESKELVGGYMLIEASDLAAAVELVKRGPLPAAGGTIEIRELAGNTME